MFSVLQRREVVRVRGSTQIMKDENLLESMEIKNRQPLLAILIKVRKAFYHFGKAMTLSGMWQPDDWGNIEGMSTLAPATMDHARPPQ